MKWLNFIIHPVAYDFIEAHVNGKVGIIKLNRPKALNALCDGLIADLVHAARSFDQNPQVGAIIITGSEKAFAAGADIKEMSTRDYPDCYTNNLFRNWTDITTIVKPVCDDASIVIFKFSQIDI
jgi:enoyl-CoA hydratase/carnithine racemase